MKQIFTLIVLAVLTFIVTTPSSYALFGRIAVEKERRIEAERKLVQQQQVTDRYETTSFILGITSVAMLVVGAAIGSKGRQDADPE